MAEEKSVAEEVVVVGIETINPTHPVDLRSCPRGVWYFVFSPIYGLYFGCLRAENQGLDTDPAFRFLIKLPAPMLWSPLSAPVDAVAEALIPLSMADNEFVEGFYKDAYKAPQKSDYFIFDASLTAGIQAVYDKYAAKPHMTKWVEDHAKQPLQTVTVPA